jgi:NADH:ubiquinone oxidoreductase subunit 5 (subunit L)/multisubunit Na+/H+ antiporter MnhA subunit
MEGPTPVPALIHAATMVTAGVFLIIRCSFLFENSPIVLHLMVYVGSITLVLFGLVGLAQYDIKKIIAYSTCSQLGYMFLACGLSSYNLALFHLFNHAFFKALLSLAAGSFIHSLNGEQDIRRMGGLSKILPFTFSVFFIASLSLGGFPFFSGFYSKELIINNSFMFNNIFIYLFSVTGVCLTALYSFKLIFYLVINPSQIFKKNLYFSESTSIFNVTPLFILALASIFSGFYFKNYFVNLESNFFNNSIYFLNNINLASYFLPLFVKLLPLTVLIISLLLAIIIYSSFIFRVWYLNNFNYFVFILAFFNKRLFFDDLVNFLIFYFHKLSYVIYNVLDKGFLESFGPKNISKLLSLVNVSFVKFFHKGIIDRYSVVFFINIVLNIFVATYVYFY